MPRNSYSAPVSILVLASAIKLSLAQVSKSSPSDPSRSAQHALDLAKSGRCKEALPLLKRAIPQTTDKDLKHGAGLAGVHCAMVNNQFDAAEDFLRLLNRDFPHDPEVLYVSVHT